MTNIKFFALGGLGEIGKNMYVLEVGEKIFVFDCGSITPMSQVFGYDSIMAGYQYLIENQDRIQGIFLTHFKPKAMGGFPRIIKDLKVPFYASRFTIKAIENRYLSNEEKEDVNFQHIGRNHSLDFDDVKMEFFIVSNSVPDALGIAVKVNVGEDDNPIYKNIVYLPDFDFDQNKKGRYRTDFKTLNRIADEGVFILLSPSTGAAKTGHITTDGNLKNGLHKLMSHEGRTFIIMNADNVTGMLEVIDAADNQRRKVTIIGAKARSLVELSMSLGYTPEYEETYLAKSKLNDEYRNSPNTVVIIAGEETEQFFALQRIATFQDPKYFLKASDNVVFLLETPKKFEKVLANSWDNIWLDNANLIEFDISLMPDPMCGAEDLKLLYSLLSPEYIIPISGDYRMLKAQKSIALDYGFDYDKIIFLENGVFAKFEGNEYIDDFDSIETQEIMFGEESDSDINDYVAREREALTQEGFVIISGLINLKEREICGDIDLISQGFMPKEEQDSLIPKLNEKFKQIVNEHLRLKKIDFKELRSNLKIELSKEIQKITKKRPTLIPVIIDVSV